MKAEAGATKKRKGSAAATHEDEADAPVQKKPAAPKKRVSSKQRPNEDANTGASASSGANEAPPNQLEPSAQHEALPKDEVALVPSAPPVPIGLDDTVDIFVQIGKLNEFDFDSD